MPFVPDVTMNFAVLQDAIIRVDVLYYDENERNKLLGYPTASAMEAIVGRTIEIPQAEFFTHYLFHRIKLGQPGYRNYQTIAQRLNYWLSAIRESVDCEHSTVHTPEGMGQQLNEVSEHVGEAIGLSVINRIHKLTEADWRPLREQRGRGAAPSFDFQVASDGNSFVQVETKGSSVHDNRLCPQSVVAQKRKIEDKKAKLAVLGKEGKDPYPASVRYGTITVIDGRKDGIVRCLLTDPPPEAIDENPRRFRLLSRMRFLRDWISFISPNSPFTATLATRVADLEAMRDPFELNGVELRRGTDEPFSFIPFGAFNPRHSAFMLSKSRVTDGPSGGVVVQLSAHELFYLGIREDLIVMAARQQFEEIMAYRALVGTVQKTVDCTLSSSRFGRLNLPGSVRDASVKVGGYHHFFLTGALNYSPEGLVFGTLPLPES